MGAVSIHTGSAPRTLMWWMRARGLGRAFDGSLGSDEHGARAVRDLAGDAGGEPAAFGERLEAGHLFGRSVTARSFVGRHARERRRSRARNAPRLWPAIARRWLSSAKASMSSRERFHFSAIISADRNCEIGWSP